MNNKNVPKIRLKDFGEEWKRDKMEALATFSKGRGYTKNDLSDSGTPIILYGRLYTKYETVISNIDTFVIEKEGSVISKGGEVIVPASGETPEDIVRGSVVPSPNIVLGGDLNIVYPNKNINSIFLALSISNGTMWSDLYRKSQGKSVVHLRNTDLSEVDLNFPNFAEQSQIGNFFQNIDRLITTQQNKISKLKNIKSACLDKMFPKKGTTTPKIRFKGFSGEWEEKRLGELCSTLEYGLNAASTTYDGTNKYLRITDIDDQMHFFKKDDLTSPNIEFISSDNFILNQGDILFARTGASVGKTYIYNPLDGKVYYAGFLIRARISCDFDSEFIFQNTLTHSYNNFVKVTSQRSGQPGINAQEYASWRLLLPKSINEQNKISGFLRDIDNLILSNKTKLTKLKNIKTSFLNKMFVTKE